MGMSNDNPPPAPAAMTDEELVDAFWQAVADAETAEGSEGGKWAKAVNDGDRYRAMILAELARLRGKVTRSREAAKSIHGWASKLAMREHPANCLIHREPEPTCTCGQSDVWVTAVCILEVAKQMRAAPAPDETPTGEEKHP